MNKPEISPKFTIDDIHKIREYHYEKRKSMQENEYWEEVHTNAMQMQKEIEKARKKRLLKTNANISQ